MTRIFAVFISIMLFLSTLTSCSMGALAGDNDYDIARISSSVVDGSNEFAFEIFKKLNNEDSDKSIFISPLSISTALTMTYNGAESTTKEAMGKVLGFEGINRDVVNESFRNQLKYLKNIDKNIELNIANSIWIKDGVKIREDFVSNNRKNFDAEISPLDFSKSSFAVNTINKWIYNATKGKINKMLEPPIDPNVIMFLINAIYFKGGWSKEFDSKMTYDHAFKAFGGREQTVRMMSRTGKVEFGKGDDYKAVRLPYGSGKTSMYCILPEEGIDINKFIENMSYEKWSSIRKSIREQNGVVLKIPRFKLEYGIKSLNDSLESLGMGEAFSESADFSGIKDGIYISKVLHKAVIEVNEKGSEAAAATAVVMDESAALDPLSFIADRPFVFVIADDTTGAILFMGKLLSIE